MYTHLREGAMRNTRGFTLLELMVVLAIVAIVGAVAFPSFTSSVRKGRRSDASDAATAVLQAQERWRSNNTSYTTALDSLNLNSTSKEGYYTLSVAATSGVALSVGYTLTVAAASGKSQTKDSGCTSMTVVVANGNPVYAPANCWSR